MSNLTDFLASVHELKGWHPKLDEDNVPTGLIASVDVYGVQFHVTDKRAIEILTTDPSSSEARFLSDLFHHIAAGAVGDLSQELIGDRMMAAALQQIDNCKAEAAKEATE